MKSEYTKTKKKINETESKPENAEKHKDKVTLVAA